MKTGAQLSRTENVWIERVKSGRRRAPARRYDALDRCIRRGLILVTVNHRSGRRYIEASA
mgnify:CR=1 FL=1